MQSQRISTRQHEAFGDLARQIDLKFFIVALRQFVRSVQLVQRRAEPEASQKIGTALSQFDGALPGAKDLRDWLEHFDEYESGTGNDQKRASNAEPMLTWFARGSDTYSVAVSVQGLRDLTLEITEATAAAEVLLSAVGHAVD